MQRGTRAAAPLTVHVVRPRSIGVRLANPAKAITAGRAANPPAFARWISARASARQASELRCDKIEFVKWRLSATLLLCLVVGGQEFARLAASLRAHACCMQQKRGCGHASAPDECCSRMGHTAAQPFTATIKHIATHAPLAAVTVAVHASHRAYEPFRDTPARDVFTRPHDPPHLHTFALLI